MIPKSKWKWYGYPGHLIVGSRCAYHLSTRIGKFLVSTVGDYRPDKDEKRETIGAGKDDFFETMVFSCNGETRDGDPNVTKWLELYCERYGGSLEAENGHHRWCERMAKQ